MAIEGDAEKGGGMINSESNASLLVGEGINSREGSPTNDKDHDTVQQSDSGKDEEPPKISTDDGKPPRRPSLLKQRPNTVPHHRSIPSADASALSALTADEFDQQDIDLRFGRSYGVSWENQDPGLAMPRSGDANDSANPVPPMSPTSIGATPPPPKQKARENWGKLKQTLGVNAASVKEVNPLETEAEAAILRVVERARKANAAKAGNILPHVSDEAAEVLMQEDATTPEQSNLTSSRKSSNPVEKSVLSRGTTATSAAAKATGHNRTKTLDNTLFDLANQMETLQNGPGGTFTADTGGGRGRLFSGEDIVLPEPKGNSGDVLAQNAAVLFRRSSIARKESRANVTIQDERPSSPQSTRIPVYEENTDAEDSFAPPIDSIVVDDVDIETGVDVEVAPEGDSPPAPGTTGRRKPFKLGKGARTFAQAKNQEMKEDFDAFWKFLQPRGRSIKFYLLVVVFCVIIPLIATSAILFHSGNPDLGREGASWSWFLLFLSRNVITGTLAKATEVIVIDLLSLHFRLTTRIFGTIFTLLLVQSKGELSCSFLDCSLPRQLSCEVHALSLYPGWPFLVFSWGVNNFALNSGKNAFAQHWLYWQDALPLFNATNPSGTITYSYVNHAVNGIAVALGFVVALKRLWWGLYLGKRSYREYLLYRVHWMKVSYRSCSRIVLFEIQGIMVMSLPKSSRTWLW
jgi:hypothetical protein